MDRLHKDADKQAQQREAAQRAEDVEAADQAKKQGQVEYLRSLGKPGERALQAFRAAGVPLGHLPPELVVAFEHRADGSFVLKLARELKVHIGAQALLLGTTISGVLAQNELRHVQGLRAERAQGNAQTSHRVSRVTVQGTEVVVETDAPGEAQRRFLTAALSAGG